MNKKEELPPAEEAVKDARYDLNIAILIGLVILFGLIIFASYWLPGTHPRPTPSPTPLNPTNSIVPLQAPEGVGPGKVTKTYQHSLYFQQIH